MEAPEAETAEERIERQGAERTAQIERAIAYVLAAAFAIAYCWTANG